MHAKYFRVCLQVGILNFDRVESQVGVYVLKVFLYTLLILKDLSYFRPTYQLGQNQLGQNSTCRLYLRIMTELNLEASCG